MKWSDDYAIGIERIDDQHRMLFKMAEDFRTTLNEGLGARVYGGLLESLLLYARGHFGFEEHCMHRYQCPAAETNSRAHGQFIEALTGFQERYAVGGYDRSEAQNLLQFFDAWLTDHICRIDFQLKPYVENA